MDKVLFSSQKDDWETPSDLFDDLNKKFKFDLDACANDSNHKLSNYYSEANSCLDNQWEGNVFMNPPYGRGIYQFIQKAYEEHLRDGKRFIVMLIPSRTDTKYWHNFIQDKAVVKFIRGRLKFEVGGQPKDAAPFPSCLVVYGL